jgi:hypothetical protein
MSEQVPDIGGFLGTTSSGGTAKFAEIGDSVTGTIVGVPSIVQQTTFKTNEPLVWSDGSPRWQMVVVLATNESNLADTDSHRRLYVKGQLKDAIKAACQVVKANGIEPGGRLKVEYVGDSATSGGFSAKQYAAKYLAPGEDAAAVAPASENVVANAREALQDGLAPSSAQALADAGLMPL